MVHRSPRQVLRTQYAAVVGNPVEHSLSPVLHQAAYDALGLSDWRFEHHQLDVETLPAFVCGRDERWRGLSVTMPLKEAALALADHASPIALSTGAANTLVRRGLQWHADNTDVAGIRKALMDAGVRPGRTGTAVLLGSGATARSAVAAFADLGVREVVFAVRGHARSETLDQAAAAGITSTVIPLDQVPALVVDAALTVSTLPAGAADAVAAGLDELAGTVAAAGRPAVGGVLLDVVYAGWPTRLGQAAQHVGLRVVPGIEMLIHQGAEQVRLMTGLDAPLAAMQAAGRAAQRITGS